MYKKYTVLNIFSVVACTTNILAVGTKNCNIYTHQSLAYIVANDLWVYIFSNCTPQIIILCARGCIRAGRV